MRKLTFLLLLFACVLLCAFASAEQLTFSSIKATVELTDAYKIGRAHV